MNRIKAFFLLAAIIFCGQSVKVFGQNTWNTVPYNTETETTFYGLDVLSDPMAY